MSTGTRRATWSMYSLCGPAPSASACEPGSKGTKNPTPALIVTCKEINETPAVQGPLIPKPQPKGTPSFPSSAAAMCKAVAPLWDHRACTSAPCSRFEVCRAQLSARFTSKSESTHGKIDVNAMAGSVEQRRHKISHPPPSRWSMSRRPGSRTRAQCTYKRAAGTKTLTLALALLCCLRSARSRPPAIVYMMMIYITYRIYKIEFLRTVLDAPVYCVSFSIARGRVLELAAADPRTATFPGLCRDIALPHGVATHLTNPTPAATVCVPFSSSSPSSAPPRRSWPRRHGLPPRYG